MSNFKKTTRNQDLLNTETYNNEERPTITKKLPGKQHARKRF